MSTTPHGSTLSLAGFGFFEIIVVAALGFAAYKCFSMKDVNGKDVNDAKMVGYIVACVAAYLLFAGMSNSQTSFGEAVVAEEE